MNRSLVLLMASRAALAGLVWLIPANAPKPIAPTTDQSADSRSAAKSLVVFCAASNRAVMEAVRADYEAEFGVPVNVQYGPSQTLLANLEVSGAADLYLPADDSYLAIGRERQLIDETIPVAEMHAVLAVPKAAAASISSLADVLASDR
jgi:molybdate transport system substrate-binding protein